MLNLHEKLTELSSGKFGIEPNSWWLKIAVDVTLLIGLLVLAWLIYQVCYRVVTKTVTRWFEKSKNTWDDEFIESGIFKRLSRLIPALVLWVWVPAALRVTTLSHWAQVLFTILLILMSLGVIFSALNTFLGLYERREISREVPLQSISQTIKILLSIGACILILSTILGKSPALIFSGFGALTAILMLVFKDSILGLAAGLQLSSNRLIAVGDWIEVPKFGADGNVLELALTTVKVQNWDKTITTIPTYALISDSFKNWRGMSASGIRRIKRSININLDTVRFLEEDEINNLTELPLLSDYIARKKEEFAESENTSSNPQNKRQLTNLGTYRAYLQAYLKSHAMVAENATQLVRQLQPTEKGLPIELYLFSKDNNWIEYENFQSDLMDHFISILPEFGLRAHQDPTGYDFRESTS